MKDASAEEFWERMRHVIDITKGREEVIKQYMKLLDIGCTVPPKDIFQFFYAEDNLDAEVWDKRSLGSDERFTDKDEIAWLAFEFGVTAMITGE